MMLVLAVFLLFIAAYMVVVEILDPYQRYGAKDYCINHYYDQLAGIIEHHDYNAAIVGSSMTMNIFPSRVDSLYAKDDENRHTINLSFGGYTHRDQEVLLPFLLSAGRVDHITISLDLFAYYSFERTLEPSFFDRNPLNDYQYMFRISTVKDLFDHVATPLDSTGKFTLQMSEQRKVEVVKKSYREYMLNPSEKKAIDWQKARNLWDEIFLKPVADNADNVDWNIIFPPYGLHYWYLNYRKGMFPELLALKEYMIGKLMEIPGIRVYDFQCEERYVGSVEKYMDHVHPNHEICMQLMVDIYNDSCRITADNYHAKLSLLNQIVLAYAAKQSW